MRLCECSLFLAAAQLLTLAICFHAGAKQGSQRLKCPWSRPMLNDFLPLDRRHFDRRTGSSVQNSKLCSGVLEGMVEH